MSHSLQLEVTRTPSAISARNAGMGRACLLLHGRKTASRGSDMASGMPVEKTENATEATAAFPSKGDHMETTHAVANIAHRRP